MSYLKAIFRKISQSQRYVALIKPFVRIYTHASMPGTKDGYGGGWMGVDSMECGGSQSSSLYKHFTFVISRNSISFLPFPLDRSGCLAGDHSVEMPAINKAISTKGQGSSSFVIIIEILNILTDGAKLLGRCAKVICTLDESINSPQRHFLFYAE